ncbi:MAG: Gfo/Idh/MocA family oxidoreductase [Pseudomonadota bacterium]
MNPLRIGLLGAAAITPEAIIAPARVMPRVTVTRVAARDPARAEAFAREHGVPRTDDDYAALVASDEVDLVYCALPISHHAHWSIRALEAGKHVLCEKPFAMNETEARAVLEVAERTGRRVIEAFHYRHHPVFATCLEWVREGLVGTLEQITAEFAAPVPIDPADIRSVPALGGGALMDLGCYPLRWIDDLTDGTARVTGASASLAETGVDRAFEVELAFDGGRATAHTAMGAGTGLSIQLHIQGSAGQIRFRNPLAPQHGAQLELTGTHTQVAPVSAISTYCYQLAEVSEALASGAPLVNEGARILRQQRLLDASYRAAGLAQLRASTAFTSTPV